ncbi:hypothetical protein BKA70DRAFT_1556397 [Coprinopsis sp. MPI-PUGE-AT-0042]|nr:hypothetical protein BKA70DRAFT_1556397 [Coprinopsis sp. MPI-PUGE-AT-0042]
MPQIVTKTYGRRSNSSAGLKRKTPSEPSTEDDDDVQPLPEKRRKVIPASSAVKPYLVRADSGKPTTKSIPSATPATPTKLTKRMLGRSRTETSVIPDIDTAPPVRRTPSLPTIPSSPSTPSKPTRPSYGSPLRGTSSSNVMSTSAASITGNTSLSFSATTSTTSRTTAVKAATRTYAGRSRSFLVPLSGVNPLDANGNSNGNNLLTEGEEELDDEFSRESYASLRQRWGVDASEDDPWDDLRESQGQSGSQTPNSAEPSPSKAKGKAGHAGPAPMKGRTRSNGTSQTLPVPEALPSNMMNPLKSITELRNKGESRRFLDEVAYLLDGMKAPKSGQPNIGLVRASAQELVTKLLDTEFTRKAKAADIYGKVYNLLVETGAGTGKDKVLDTILLAFLVLLARDPAALVEIGEMHTPTYEAVSGSRDPKGKGKAKAESKSLVDILFILVDSYAAEEERPNDPLVLASDPSFTSVDVYFRKAGMGKKEKASVMAIYSILSSQHLLSTSSSKSTTTPLSTPSVAVHLLQVLPPTLLPNHKWRANILVKSLTTTLQQAVDGSPPKCKPDQWHTLHAHLRLLDLYLLGQWSYPASELEEQEEEDGGAGDDDWEPMVDSLMLLGEAAATWDPSSIPLEDDQDDGSGGSGDEDEEEKGDKPKFRDGATVDLCLEALLRVVVTFTHGDNRWARRVVFKHGGTTAALSWLTMLVKDSGEKVKLPTWKGEEASSLRKRNEKGRGRTSNQGPGDGADTEEDADADDEVVSEGVQHRMRQKRLEERARALDRLCLALALLTNLVQAVEGVVDLFREAGTLLALVGLYEQQGSEASVQDAAGLNEEEAAEAQQAQADASFLRGHLAVLFGLLMKENEENVDMVLEILPRRGESTKIKLNRLVDQARRFVSFFDVVQASQHHEDGGLNEDEQNEKKVAQDVLEFLQLLRDGINLPG